MYQFYIASVSQLMYLQVVHVSDASQLVLEVSYDRFKISEVPFQCVHVPCTYQDIYLHLSSDVNLHLSSVCLKQRLQIFTQFYKSCASESLCRSFCVVVYTFMPSFLFIWVSLDLK